MTSQNYTINWLDTASESILLWRFPQQFIYSHFAQSYHDVELSIRASPAAEVSLLLDLSYLQTECSKPLGITNHLSVAISHTPKKLSRVIVVNSSRLIYTVIDIVMQSNPHLAGSTLYTGTISEAYQKLGLNGV